MMMMMLESGGRASGKRMGKSVMGSQMELLALATLYEFQNSLVFQSASEQEGCYFLYFYSAVVGGSEKYEM